jgi:hypothetical protein
MTAGLCGPREEAGCREEMDAGELEWACENCPKTRIEELHPYTGKLIRIHNLQTAGYPLAADDLTLDEWIDLGRLKECLTRPPSKSASTSTAKPA